MVDLNISSTELCIITGYKIKSKLNILYFFNQSPFLEILGINSSIKNNLSIKKQKTPLKSIKGVF